MDRIRRQKTFLEAITSVANRNARKALIKHTNKDQVNAVSEIVINLLKNNVPVTPVTMARLRFYKQILRQIGNRAVSLKKRRQALINQKGGKLWNGLTTVVKTCCRYRQRERNGLSKIVHGSSRRSGHGQSFQRTIDHRSYIGYSGQTPDS